MFKIYKKEERPKEWAFDFSIDNAGEMIVTAVDSLTGTVLSALFKVTVDGKLMRYRGIDLKGYHPKLKLDHIGRMEVIESLFE